jgi:hypothetical protein
MTNTQGGRANWEGPVNCAGRTAGGMPCSNREIEGLEYCLAHIPDDMLEEAEEITGYRRCRHGFGTPGACRRYAIAGTEPPQCQNHGAPAGSVRSKAAALRVIDGQAERQLTEIMAADGGNFFDGAQAIDNPLTELLELAGRIKWLETKLSERIATIDISKWRYTRDRIGEQVRAEVILLERAQERLGHLLVQIAKLNITERLAGIEQRKLDMLERAMTMALQAADVSPEKREVALKVMRRELKAVA